MSKIGYIALYMLQVRDNIKLYHWATTSYARHKASDKFIVLLDTQIDKFIELLQGSRSERIEVLDYKYSITSINNNNVIEYLQDFKNWLLEADFLNKNEVDLYNLRDEMVGNINITLYLFTLA